MTRTWDRSLVAMLAALCVPLSASAQEKPRIGWEESFDDITKWKQALSSPHAGTPPVSVTAEAGCINIVTPVGALNPKMKRADWPEWPKDPATSFTNFDVRYDDVVDLDTYRYVVIRIREKATFFFLSMAGKGLKVPYTTGLHAQDLRPLGLTGKQPVRFYGQFLNTHGHVKIDYIRLVRELTGEEKKGFIGEGLTIRAEKQTSHPYHRLEALSARAGRPARQAGQGGEWVVYRDTGTGVEVWKMTDLAADEHRNSFNCDGSAFTVASRPGQGVHVFDWTDREFKLIKGGLSDARPRFSTTEPAAIIVAENTWLPRTPGRRPRRVTIHHHNFRTGERSKIASFQPKTWRVQEFASSPDSSKMVFGLRESPVVFLIDPDAPEAKRVREIKLTTRLKGVRLANKDTELHWNNCYTYQGLMMDLKTGKVSQGNRPCAGGHSAGGPHWTVGPYGQLMKLLIRNGLHPQTEATADDTRIFANYARPVVTDYGHVSTNGKWMVTNGARGDVRGQHLMISTADPATVLRVCHYNTSRNNWPTNTYSRTSPDATKLAYVSDQLGNGDVYMAVTGRPAPPTGLKVMLAGGRGVRLAWQAPKGAREVGGYRVYRSRTSGRGFVALNRTPVKAATYADKSVAAGPRFYLVAMVEPSGLEGHFSSEAAIGGQAVAPRTFYVEAETCRWSAPLREVISGGASGSRYLRYHRASPDEPKTGVLKCALDLPPGKFTVWLRSRDESKGQRWSWRKTAHDARAGEIKMSSDGLAVDRLCITSDPKCDPGKSDALTGPPDPVKKLAVAGVTAQSVKLSWQAGPARNIARYDVHVGGDAAKLGNETIIGSTVATAFEDWGLKPGSDYAYHVVAVDSRGGRSKPVSLKVRTKDQLVQTLEAAQLEKAPTKVTFAVDVKAEAPFLAWAKYQPAYTGALRVGVEVDGKLVGRWRLRAPYRPMGRALTTGGKGAPRVFVDKVIADGKDVFRLTPGRHTIAFVPDPKLGADKHVFEKLTLSNDHSLRPAGYDPRADFKKATRRY